MHPVLNDLIEGSSTTFSNPPFDFLLADLRTIGIYEALVVFWNKVTGDFTGLVENFDDGATGAEFFENGSVDCQSSHFQSP